MSINRHGVVTGLRVLAALAFCDAGWIKIQSAQAFADNIATFQILPASLNNWLAISLPTFELSVGILLLSGWKVRTSAFCGLAACGIFLLALVSAMVRGLPVECGCFGDAHSALAPIQRLWLAIGRDVFLAGTLVVVYLDASHRENKSHPVFSGGFQNLGRDGSLSRP